MTVRNSHPRLGIIGGGRAAWAFANLWRQAGWRVGSVSIRRESISSLPPLLGLTPTTIEETVAAADVLFYAVPDGAIQSVDDVVVRTGTTARAFHASGAQSSLEIRGGSARFSLHPLRSLPPVGNDISFEGTLFVYEGAESCGALAAELCQASGARVSMIDPAAKPLYHAAAVLGANCVAAVADLALEMMNRAGVRDTDLRRAVHSLATSALMNWRDAPGAAGFTGPAIRRDAETIGKNLAALDAAGGPAADVYRLASEHILSRISAKEAEKEAMDRIFTMVRAGRTLP